MREMMLFGGCLCFLLSLHAQPEAISPADMEKIYQEVRTPHKFGLVLVAERKGDLLDCPSVYRQGRKWYMTYILFDGSGYETWQAESADLLRWKTLGKQLARSDDGRWDAKQCAGYNALIDPEWEGSHGLGTFQGKYWMSYFGGADAGYEPEPQAIGMAHTDRKPVRAMEWTRSERPVLSSGDKDVRWWENRRKLFKSYVLEDPQRNTGHRFVMYYNAVGDSLPDNKPTRWYERIGMAVSDDMANWTRYGRDPVVHHPAGITGDPMVRRINGTWVMFYFGAFWEDRKGAFNRFAASKDLVHWTDWQGDNLIESSEDFDRTYAHKPFVLKHKGTVYHFYCAVDEDGNRGIALATSKNLGTSALRFTAK